VDQQVSYGNRKLFSRNGSHSYKDVITFTKIVGYKNVEDLYSRVNPYIFSWDETDFKFTFNVHYYGLSTDEWEEYRRSIRGLGLDKAYAVDLEVGGVRKWVYRNKSDIFYMRNGKEVQTGSLAAGMLLSYDGGQAVVRGVYSKSTDAGYAARVVRAQQCNSRAVQKLDLLVELLRLKDAGALVYFNFLESVEVTYRRLCQEFPGRRIVKLTGKTQRFSLVVSSICENDIVLMSSVASQSLDMYISRLFVMESYSMTPGKFQQLCGRMTRENASFRDVSVDFIVREGDNVEAYFYEKLRLRLRHVRSDAYVTKDSLPVLDCIRSIPEELVDEDFLKERLLWSGK
jgi:hypothetical protein